MSINKISALSSIVHTINNPNLPLGTLIEEVPADVGRSWEGYKRGGPLEGSEKMSKELMAAAVWMLGIPGFKSLGNFICERFLKIPMDIDICKTGEGNNTIGDSVEFLTKGVNKKNLDASGLAKYGDKFKGMNAETLIKKVTAAKKVTGLAALLINCAMMGIVLPKFNQAITARKLQKQKKENYAPDFQSFDEFKKGFSNEKTEVSFGNLKTISDIISPTNVVYQVENNNIFRLISTDIPMIIGRVAVSRNKYEGLENLVMDATSIYFYNFCAGHVQQALRKATNTPLIQPTIAETIANQSKDVIENAIKKVKGSDKAIPVKELFGEKLANEIYTQATYNKFGKINKFVKTSDLQATDLNVANFLKTIDKQSNGSITPDVIKRAARNINIKNAGFLGLGLAISAFGLGVAIPKATFWMTRKLTGQNTFTGITDYSEKK